MKRFPRRICRCLSLLVLTPMLVVSSPSANNWSASPGQFTLADAKRIAFERNWDLLAAKSGIDAAQAQLIVAKEFPNPTFSYSTAKIGSHENSTPVGNGLWSRSYDTIFAVNQLKQTMGNGALHGTR